MTWRAAAKPDREGFEAQASAYSVVPVFQELSADWWTPVSAFHRLAREAKHAFLLESVEGGERVGRYSFLGRDPYLTAQVREGRVHWDSTDPLPDGLPQGEPLTVLREWFSMNSAPRPEGLPPFVTGGVGYFGFDTVRWVEDLPMGDLHPAREEDAQLLFFREVVAFDHVRRKLVLVVNVPTHTGDPKELYDGALDRIDHLHRELHTAFAPPPDVAQEPAPAVEPTANLTPDTFRESVRRIQEYIAAGDVFQVVLSQRFSVPSPADDFDLYRSLRAINPSPYMFLLRLEEWSAVGSSPEPLLRVQDGRLSYRPIAGTAPRSGDPEEDARRAEAMKADPKERAEHVMLVDLGRNDLGRVAVTGTVSVDELMVVERYSHVVHMVSGLSAELRPELLPLDALFSCLPAGTVSGAPKVRALEIIEELEPDRRGLYAGAVGYFDFSGNLDTCIALRTMVVRDGVVTVQAGAGIVADSDPQREYEETRHKAQALLEAVRMASPGGADS